MTLNTAQKTASTSSVKTIFGKSFSGSLANAWSVSVVPERGEGGGRGGAVLLLAFHWDGSEVKRVLCSIAKVSVISVSLPFSAVIPALVGLDSSF